MTLHTLQEKQSILNEYISALRDEQIQKDRMRFRRNLQRIGWIMAYEISKKLSYASTEIKTPLATTSEEVLKEQPYLISILRAATPVFQGFLDVFDQADSGFIGAYRAPIDKYEFDIAMNYEALNSIDDKVVLLIDPMLATGKSLATTISRLLKNGTPRAIHVASVISARPGIEAVEKVLREQDYLWTVAIDEKLNEKYYILPGLGDAGDLSFGGKL